MMLRYAHYSKISQVPICALAFDARKGIEDLRQTSSFEIINHGSLVHSFCFKLYLGMIEPAGNRGS